MKKRLKRLLIILMMTLIPIMFVNSTASAFTPGRIGEYVYHNRITVMNSGNTYCTQANGSLRAEITRLYQVTNYVRIEGKTAKGYNGRTTTNDSNAILAYILGGGNFAKGSGALIDWGSYMEASPRQYALWKHLTNWSINSGERLGIYVRNSSNDAHGQYNDVYAAAKNYAKSFDGSSSTASIKALQNKVITSNTYAGPFNVTYSGKISSVQVKAGNTDISNNVEFYSDKDGKNKISSISKIKSGEDFYIKNETGNRLTSLTVTVTGGGTVAVDLWFLTSGGGQNLLSVNPSVGPSKASTTIQIETYGDLVLEKIDEKSGNPLDGVQFKLKVKNAGWVSVKGQEGKVVTSTENVKYNYNSEKGKATAFETSGGKGITLKDLDLRVYHIYETKAAPNYVLSLQEGYDADNNWVDCGEVSMTSAKKTVKCKNQKPINISGYVWVDAPINKETETNNLMDDRETKVSGVKVQLINKTTKKPIKIGDKDYVLTDAQGKYLFENKVTDVSIKNYYVSFDYRGTNYKGYIPVAYNADKAENIRGNGSRAIVNSMPTYDKDLGGIIPTTYTGTQEEGTYGLSGILYENDAKTGLYNAGTNTLENINLGIKELIKPKYEILQDVNYVIIKMKGYTYKYIYGGEEQSYIEAAPKVKLQIKGEVDAYTREIHPSDIVYNDTNKKNNLQVYVGYRIDIINTTDFKWPDYYPDYDEQQLLVKQVKDEFDTNRYILHDSNWTLEKDGTAVMSDLYRKISYGDESIKKGIAPGKNNKKYGCIEFQVKENAIKEILKHPNGIAEEYPTKATSIAYHEYKRFDYSWNNKISKPDIHYSIDETKSDEAPYMVFKMGTARTISGTVFEDTVVTNNGEKLGNGRYNQGENTVENVKVELLDTLDLAHPYIVENNKVSHIYGLDQEGKEYEHEAVTYTDSNGHFVIGNVEGTNRIGIVPGEYYLRFTYGDGKQTIHKLDGTEVLDGKAYKSTIVKSAVVENAFTHEEPLWYQNLEGKDYSVAIDNINTKEAVNTGKGASLLANTPKISITLENTKGNSSLVTGDGKIVIDNKIVEGTEKFEGFNLGVIKAPEQKVQVHKIIDNIALSLTEAQVVFDGNPEKDKMKGVSDLDNENNGGSKYTRVEVEENSIYGSKLLVTYKITATNVSDLNYYDDSYYHFGKGGKHEVALTVEEIKDMLAKDLDFVETQNEGKVLTLNKEENIMTITGDNKDILYTSIVEGRNVKTTTTPTYLKATRILSNEDDDLEYENTAQITTALNTGESSDGFNIDFYKNTVPAVKILEPDTVRTVLTPPTGADGLSIILYVVAGAAMLAVLSAGVIVIKKKVM